MVLKEAMLFGAGEYSEYFLVSGFGALVLKQLVQAVGVRSCGQT